MIIEEGIQPLEATAMVEQLHKDKVYVNQVIELLSKVITKEEILCQEVTMVER